MENQCKTVTEDCDQFDPLKQNCKTIVINLTCKNCENKGWISHINLLLFDNFCQAQLELENTSLTYLVQKIH